MISGTFQITILLYTVSYIIKVQAQFKSTTSKIHPGRSGVASINFKFAGLAMPGWPGMASLAWPLAGKVLEGASVRTVL
jgi:hypothetical protein